MKKKYRCEWGGMWANYWTETPGQARYKAFKVLKEYWGLNRIVEIKVTRVKE